MEFECRLRELDEYLGRIEVQEEFEEDFYECMLSDCEALCITGPDIEVDGFEMAISEGVFCEASDDGALMPDWSFTIVRKLGDCWREYIYLEQDPIPVALHNFSRVFDVKLDMNAKCTLKHKEMAE